MIKKEQLTASVFAKLREISTATLTTQLLKRGFRNTFLQLTPLKPEQRMVGYAFTLRYVPLREDLVDTQYNNKVNAQRVAVETIGADEVLVIDARGDIRAASFGHILATRIQARGAAGLVTDGALRDTPGFKQLAHDGYEQKLREQFLTKKVAAGAALHGVYPPNEETLAEFVRWREVKEERNP